ncbi:MAG: hypothetical protein EPO02_02890 [Nitrospirae bacterium]|nr:MAG: hypothetical protein EPO02_02890 [Nitrospirota bacterium]
MLIALASALSVLPPVDARACDVRVDDPAVTFPLDKIDRPALCRMAPVVNDYTTHRILPPYATPIPKPVYDFMLDHMVLSSALARKLELADYRIARVGPAAFHGDDNAGSEGVITLLYRDTTRRVYHMKGSHRGKIIPEITGEAIILLSYHVKAGADGREQIETRITTYSRLDNPVIATLVKVFHPLLRRVVNDKLAQGFFAVHRLGELMATDPELVSRQAETVPDADQADVEALRLLLLPALKRER